MKMISPFVVGMLIFFSISIASTNQLSSQNILKFDGVDNYITIDGVTGDITGTNLSIEVRFKTNAEPSNNSENQIISFQGVNDNDVLGIGIGVNGSINIKTNAGSITRGSGYNDNRWHLLSIVTSDSTVYAYIDGVNSLEFNSGSINLNLFTRCSIGQEYNQGSTSNHFKGKVSELRIWDQLLTIESIDERICTPLTGSENNLIAAYDFEQSAGGASLLDDSPNNNTGTIENIDLAADWVLDAVICDNSINDLIQFSIVGDAPYDLVGNIAGLDTLTAHVLENNAHSYAEFLIHVGDIKKGSTPCDTSYYYNAKGVFNLSTKLPYVLIGDNEWNDCTNPTTGLSQWNTYFTDLNNQFKDSLQVNSQTGRNENISYLQNSVLFITINQVGGRIHDLNEWIQRQADNGDWIVENLTKYESLARACVIYAHARPDYAIFEVGDTALYQPLLASVDSFSKPVLYIQGDEHIYYQVDNYGGKTNLLKVVIDSDERTDDFLQVVVSKDTSEAFYFERLPFTPAIIGSATLTEIDSTTVSISWETDASVASVVRYGQFNGPLIYRAEDPTPKTNHQVSIPNLSLGTTFRFEVGTRTARLDSSMLEYDVVSSTQDITYHHDMIVYPNPTSDYLNISFDHTIDNQYRIEIVDLLGRVVISQQLKSTISTSNLKSGAYVLHIYSPTNRHTIHQQLMIKN